MFELDGKVAIVTGGNGGIGLGIARGLAGAGARVVVAARDAAKSAAARDELGAGALAIERPEPGIVGGRGKRRLRGKGKREECEPGCILHRRVSFAARTARNVRAKAPVREGRTLR